MKLFKALVGLAAAASVIPLKVEKVEEDGKKTVRISSLTWKAEYTSATLEDDATLNVDLMGGLKELVKKKEKTADEEEVLDAEETLEEVEDACNEEEEVVDAALIAPPVPAPDFDLADRISGGGIRWADLEESDSPEEEEEAKELTDEDLKEIAGHFGELLEEADSLLCDAVDTVVELGKASTSLLQRKLTVGYGRAAKMIDAMYKSKIVSDPKGAKPRDVLITVEQWNKIKVQIGKAKPVDAELTAPETETE